MADWDAGAAPLLGVALGVVTLHCFTAGKDLWAMAQQLSRSLAGARTGEGKSDVSGRLDAAMERLREDSFMLSYRMFQHVMALSLVVSPMAYRADPTLAFFLMCSCSLAYVMNKVLVYRAPRLSARYLRALFICFYLVVILFTACPWMANTNRNVQMFLAACEFSAAVCFVDCRVHIAGQVGILLAEASRQVSSGGTGCDIEALLSQAMVSMAVGMASLVLESILRQRLEADLQRADAESIVAGFRAVLRGVCDGELLLDGDLNIQEGMSCLSRLLSTQEDLKGKPFVDLLARSEKDRGFEEFAHRKSDSGHSIHWVPACQRISFKNAQIGHIGVDAFHVPLPHLHGSDVAYHLVVLKLDPEYPIHAASQVAPPLDLAPGPLEGQLASATSDPSESIKSFSGLREILFLVSQNARMDVRQVHLNYKEAAESQGSQDPGLTLQKLIQPSDWSTVRSCVQSFGRVPEERMPSISVRMIDRPTEYVQCRHAMLKTYPSDARYLWLHLRGFKQRKEPRLGSAMADLGEAEDD